MTVDTESTTLTEALAASVRRRGDSPFIRHGDDSTSFAALDASSARLARGLLALGLGPGDRIGLLALNQIEWVQLFFAATRIGAVVVGMSLRYRESELDYMVRDSQVKAVALLTRHEGQDFGAMLDRLALPTLQCLIVLDADADADADAGKGQPAGAGALPRVSFDRLLEEPAGAAAAERTAGGVRPSDFAMVIYTSGTTGRPKGAGLTHASLLASARAQAVHTRAGPDDRLPLPLPLNHVGGITCGILTLLLAGGCVDLLPEFRASLLLERIRRHPPTMLGGVPTMMTLLLMESSIRSADLSSIRIVYVGGSSVDAALLTRLDQRMPKAKLMNLYGLSESSGAIVMTPWDATAEETMTVLGQPIGGAEVRVVDPAGRALPAGEIGELCFRGAGVVPGYVGAAGERTDGFLPGGWLRSGDLGLQDGRGTITLKGRAKDMYIQGGFNVYPAEVESHMARHPAVLMVAGIGVPDPVLGEIGRYFVVRRPGATLSGPELQAFCAAGLADYKVPRQVVFREQLPLTPAGKIHKAALRAEEAADGARS